MAMVFWIFKVSLHTYRLWARGHGLILGIVLEFIIDKDWYRIFFTNFSLTPFLKISDIYDYIGVAEPLVTVGIHPNDFGGTLAFYCFFLFFLEPFCPAQSLIASAVPVNYYKIKYQIETSKFNC